MLLPINFVSFRVLPISRSGRGITPLPVNVTVCGLPSASSSKLRVAVKVPLVGATNCTFTVQVPPTASTLLLQVSPAIRNELASAPVKTTFVMVSAAEPQLVNVTLNTLDVLPTPAVSDRLLTDWHTWGAGAVPVPVSGTV